MNIVMSGSTGFVGRYLSDAFTDEGWTVIPLKREDFTLADDDFLRKCEGADAVVNLAGAPIVGRWTEEYKKTLMSSRLGTTRKIVNALKRMAVKPDVFISTSAVGIYSSEGVHTEDHSKYSKGFLGELALSWEAEALKAEQAGVRTVIFRFGIVLGRNGGALEKMLIPFKLGLGGILGDGKQAFSWIHIEDLKRAYFAAIGNKGFSGIYNLTAPHPVTNKGLTRALGSALNRPTLLKIPSFVLKAKYGEGAQAIMEGQRVVPKRLLESGFTFKFEKIEDALGDLVT